MELEIAVNDAILNLTVVSSALDSALQDLRVFGDEGDSEDVRVLFGAHSIIKSTIDMLMKAQDSTLEDSEQGRHTTESEA